MSKIKITTIAFLCLLLFTSTTFAADVTTVTLQGTSHMEVAPDQAVVTFGITSNADSSETARNTNAVTSNAVQQKLLDLNFTKDQLHTSQFVVYPIYNSDNEKSGKPPAIIGYRVSNDLTVTIDDVSLVGNVIDAALSAGANQVTSVHFKKKSDSNLKKSLLSDAVQDALTKADAIATALGKHVTKVTSIEEHSLDFQSPEAPRYMLMEAKAVGNTSSTSLSSGMIIANGSISLVCEMQ